MRYRDTSRAVALGGRLAPVVRESRVLAWWGRWVTARSACATFAEWRAWWSASRVGRVMNPLASRGRKTAKYVRRASASSRAAQFATRLRETPAAAGWALIIAIVVATILELLFRSPVPPAEWLIRGYLALVGVGWVAHPRAVAGALRHSQLYHLVRLAFLQRDLPSRRHAES